MVNGQLCKHANQVSSPHVEEASNDLKIVSTSNPIQLLPELEAKHQKQNFGKVANSNNGCSKRSQVTQLEVRTNETETNDKKGKAKEVGLSPAKCIVAERIQTPKQKNLNGKGGDKRNGSALKGKCDSFSVKSGLASFSSATGGNNILGVYGSRPDTEDVTKHVDELSLTELLNGSYKCPSFAEEKGKKSANPNANILQSLREAWSILHMRKIKPQTVEIDGSYREVPPPSLMTSDSFVASKYAAGDKGDTNMTDLSSGNKIDYSGSKLNTSANIVDFPLYQPKDIPERLSLAPPKDLEVLLQDAAKPAAALRNNSDLRVGRPVSHRGCLPPFSWSNASSGHCKSISDAVKLLQVGANAKVDG